MLILTSWGANQMAWDRRARFSGLKSYIWVRQFGEFLLSPEQCKGLQYTSIVCYMILPTPGIPRWDLHEDLSSRSDRLVLFCSSRCSKLEYLSLPNEGQLNVSHFHMHEAVGGIQKECTIDLGNVDFKGNEMDPFH